MAVFVLILILTSILIFIIDRALAQVSPGQLSGVIERRGGRGQQHYQQVGFVCLIVLLIFFMSPIPLLSHKHKYP